MEPVSPHGSTADDAQTPPHVALHVPQEEPAGRQQRSPARSARSNSPPPTRTRLEAEVGIGGHPLLSASVTQRSQRKISPQPVRLVGGITAAAHTAVSAAQGAATVAVAVVAADAPARQANSCSALARTNNQAVAGDGSARKLRGIFFQQNKPLLSEDARDQHSQQHGRRGDYKQRLDMLLSSEEQSQAVARELFRRFDGDLGRLPSLLGLIQDKWNFPERAFPMLMLLLKRATGKTNDEQRTVSEDDWVQAFVRWLKVQQTKCGRTKVTRRHLIQKHTDQDMAEAYRMGAKLGAGSFGEVYLATHTSLNVVRVIKSMDKTRLSLHEEQVETEVDTLRSLDHPHIIRIFEAFETENQLHIVMDYAEGGDLSDAIRAAQECREALPEAWARTVAGQIASALGYMHSKGVIHCDLKPGNTMLLHPFSLAEAKAGTATPHILVADFGLAELFKDRQDGEVKGSPSYLAPEGFEGRLSQRSDLWALGVMIYEMLLGVRPFRGSSNLFTLFCQVANTDPPTDGLPPLARIFVEALMAKEPKNRPAAKDCPSFGWFAEVSAMKKEASLHPTDSHVRSLGHPSYFHRATMFCVAANLGMKDAKGILEAYRDLDTKLSGAVSMEDLRDGLPRLGIVQDPNAVMAILDLDQDGQVSYTEFLAGALRLESDSLERQLRYAFEVFDLDGDGYLDMSELRIMLSGHGSQADVLPDGATVEQVMEEISEGHGRISFGDFKAYLERTDEAYAVLASTGSATSWPMATRRSFVMHSESPSAASMVHLAGSPEELAATLVEELVANGRSSSKEPYSPRERLPETVGAAKTASFEDIEDVPFPSFHDWLAELYMDTQEGASMNRLLLFPKHAEEVNYVAYHMQSTCQQIALLATALVVYASWALVSEDYSWDPSLGRWDVPPRIAHNIAWLVLWTSGLAVVVCCVFTARRRSAEHVRARNLECILSAWACLIPWVSCFFANRYRVSALFDAEPLEVFDSMNSDYDLIVVMLGALMFLSTRTHLRFALTLPIALSSVAAYALSSTILGTPYTECGTNRNWAWPAVLLVSVSALALTGHRAVERQRRLTFLSLQASYNVLKELNDDPGPAADAKSGRPATAETRTARLKHALETTRRLSNSTDLASRPLRAALMSLVEVLEGTREDIAHADRLLTVDVRETLEGHGIGGAAEDLLLALMEAPPRTLPADNLPADEATGAFSLEPWATARDSSLAPAEAWGWNVLDAAIASSSSSSSRAVAGGHQQPLQRHLSQRPMAGAAADLLLSTVADAAAAKGGGGGDRAAPAKQAAGRLLDGLLRAYAAGAPAAEARAALAVLSAHWLARGLGLWAGLRPWDRVALLVAAAGLHCADGAYDGELRGAARGGALLASDPLLGAAKSMGLTLEVLDASGLAGIDRETAGLKQAVRRLMVRARPRCALEDARRVRVALDQDDQAAWAERVTIGGIVLAAADLAFLALPPLLHRQWAKLCLHEAVDVVSGHTTTSGTLLGWPGGGAGVGGVQRPSARLPPAALDAASWLRGLVQALALPIYETLARLDGAEMLLAPVGHLRQNAKHWKVTELMATAGVSNLAGSPIGQEAAAAGGRQAGLAQAAAGDSALRETAACGAEYGGRGSVSTIASTASTGQPGALRGANSFGGGGDDEGTHAMPPEDVVHMFAGTMPGAEGEEDATLEAVDPRAVLAAAAAVGGPDEQPAADPGEGATDSEVKSEGAADLLLGELLPRGGSREEEEEEQLDLHSTVATIALEGMPAGLAGGVGQAPTQNSSPSDAVAEDMATFLKLQLEPEATLREQDLPGMVSCGEPAQNDQLGTTTASSEWV